MKRALGLLAPALLVLGAAGGVGVTAVEIAKALSVNARVLIMDEPTAALDSDTQTKLMDALSDLEHTMRQLGCATLADLNPSHVIPPN